MALACKFNQRSAKTKSVDLHPTEPWVLSALYSGCCTIYNYETQALVKRIGICNKPLRCCRFIARKQWIIAAGDDMKIYIFNYNSLEKVAVIDAHTDYIRYLDVHPTLPYLLSSSDDMTIALWDFEILKLLARYEGHQHYTMMARWSPKDLNTFASCSMDRSIKFWGLPATGSKMGKTKNSAHFSLSGHEGGVNCIDFCSTCPYLISGGEDMSLRVWDYQTKTCLHVLKQHTLPITGVLYHPKLPLILSVGEDGQVKIWHSNLFKLKQSVDYLGKIWSIAGGASDFAIGTDSGTFVNYLGGDKPLVSMHGSKVVMVKGFGIWSANLQGGDMRQIGSCEFYPQSVSWHPNGRFVAVCGEEEYVVYTGQGMKSKTFGRGSHLAWSPTGDYATLSDLQVTVYRDFAQLWTFQAKEGTFKLIGGHLLAMVSKQGIDFYTWTDRTLVQTFGWPVDNVWWNQSGSWLAFSHLTTFYLSECDLSLAEAGNNTAFKTDQIIGEKISSAIWVDSTFVYVSATNELKLRIGKACELWQYLEGNPFLVGYHGKGEELVLVNNDLITVPLAQQYLKLHSLLHKARFDEKAIDEAEFNELVAGYDSGLRLRASKLLEQLCMHNLALKVTDDEERKFGLYLGSCNIVECLRLLGTSKEEIVAYGLCIGELSNKDCGLSNVDGKWKALTEKSFHWDLLVALGCLRRCGSHSELLLLQSVIGNKRGIEVLAQESREAGKLNIAFTCYYMLNNIEACIEIMHDTGRHAEATIMARTFRPSQISSSVEIWRSSYSSEFPPLLDSKTDLLNGNCSVEQLEKAVRKRLETGFPNALEYSGLKNALQVDLGAAIGNGDGNMLQTNWDFGITK